MQHESQNQDCAVIVCVYLTKCNSQLPREKYLGDAFS